MPLEMEFPLICNALFTVTCYIAYAKHFSHTLKLFGVENNYSIYLQHIMIQTLTEIEFLNEKDVFQFIFYCTFNFQSFTRKGTQLKMHALLQHATTVNSTISNWAFNLIVKYRLPCNYITFCVWIKVYISSNGFTYWGAIKGILNKCATIILCLYHCAF